MEALRVALAFRRPDVDAFLQEIDHEQFCEWAAFLTLEPEGWTATRIAVTRLSYMIAQSQSRRRLKEADFGLVIGRNIHGPETERARWEAMSIRTEIAEQMRQHG